jgi:hypothetical protein
MAFSWIDGSGPGYDIGRSLLLFTPSLFAPGMQGLY